MLGHIWRFAVSAMDWRNGLRKTMGQSNIEAVFISNMRDETDRKRYLGQWHPKEGHFNGPRYWINSTAGRTRVINSTTEDLITLSDRERAKEQFIAATQWAKDNGAKVILLAAGTKRLFGEDGAELKKKFPELLFTIGDNGTMLVLQGETFRALELAELKPGKCRIGILGPYGFLGETTTRALKNKGYDLVGAGPNTSALDRIAKAYDIETCQAFTEMGKVDAVVACTHSEKIRLTTEHIELIRRKNKRLLVIDVAEPSNFRSREYQKNREKVIRQDAGNAYSPDLKYVLGAISYRMFRLTRGVTFGCFAETLAIASTLQHGKDGVGGIDWFKVSEENMEVVADLFEKVKFTLPSARCFGRPVKSFNLDLK